MAETTQLINKAVNLQQELENKNQEIESLNNKLAEQTKEINQFTYIVSHDLQAPLRMVTGFLELLEKKYGDKLDESAKQYIGYAVKGSTKMKSLIFDLLEYSRLSSIVKEYEEVDLNSVLNAVKEKLQADIENTGAIITSAKLPVVMANKAQMEQMFYHLLDNALKFQNKAVPQIGITLKKENASLLTESCGPDRQGHWVIGVNDNGIGMDPAFSEKIFIVFRRLHTDDSKYSGTGIGLALCKKITELHGGTIWVESAIDKGSSFYFTLPVKPD